MRLSACLEQVLHNLRLSAFTRSEARDKCRWSRIHLRVRFFSQLARRRSVSRGALVTAVYAQRPPVGRKLLDVEQAQSVGVEYAADGQNEKYEKCS